MFGLIKRNKIQDPDQFWQDYAARYGETVLAYGLGRYLSGWTEFQYSLWGLIIATSGGLRFHHFPHEGWIQAISRIGSGGDAPKEKTLFIPQERILEAELRVEKSWWKRLLNPTLPRLLFRYRLEGEDPIEDILVIETDRDAAKILQHLDKQA
jgi:hypothetical protein